MAICAGTLATSQVLRVWSTNDLALDNQSIRAIIVTIIGNAKTGRVRYRNRSERKAVRCEPSARNGSEDHPGAALIQPG